MRRIFFSKTRMLIFFWAILLLALSLLCWYYYHSLKREIASEARANALQQLNLAYWAIQQQRNLKSPEELQGIIKEIAKLSGSRITYIAVGGHVIADSEVPFADIPKLDNHASRPEVVQARTEGMGIVTRFSRTSQRELIYAAKAVEKNGNIPAGVVRLAVPWSGFKERFQRLSRSFVYALVLAFAVIAVISYILLRQLDKPIQAIIDATEAIGKGNYKQRIHFHPNHEYYPLACSINQMAELIDTHVQTITEQKQQLEAIFHGLKEGVMVLDSEGKVIGINHALSRIIPNAARSTGRRPLEVLRSLELQKACDAVLSKKSDVGLRPHLLQITLEGGEKVYDVSIATMEDDEKGLGAIVVLHDISELKRLERVRQDFVANVSHELRTPLTSIKGYAETLLTTGDHDPATLENFLRIMLKNADHMVKMVDDLLQLAKLEAQQDRPEVFPVNPSDALDSAWKACRPFGDSKNIVLQNQIPSGGPSVLANFEQLVQVFCNLLENAIKYSPVGGVIRVCHETVGDNVVFSVIDQGIGIPKQHQQRVFERFYRVEKHRGNRAGSTGLGLAICRHIILNHGGEIWIRSPNESEDQGTIVSFSLPRSPESDVTPN